MPLWEILVPTTRSNPIGKNPYYRVRHHRVWDEFVRTLTGGLSIIPPLKGQWVAPDGTLFKERMIPVRIFCGEEEIEKIAAFTLKHYEQLAVMYYKISDYVVIKKNKE
jgi:hypothetical protein